MHELGFAFLAGILTSASPCVLPVLPIVLGSALQENKLGPLAVALGMSVSFTLLGLLLGSFGSILGLEGPSFRILSGFLLVFLGIALISPGSQALLERLLAPLSRGTEKFLRGSKVKEGLFLHFLTGALLGIIWSPCTGPTLGAALTLAAQGGAPLKAGGIMFVFSVGACLPLLLIGYGSRAAFLQTKEGLLMAGSWIKVVFGLCLALVGLAIILSLDKAAETLLLSLMPQWLVDLTVRF